jgi:hypothetical protein
LQLLHHRIHSHLEHLPTHSSDTCSNSNTLAPHEDHADHDDKISSSKVTGSYPRIIVYVSYDYQADDIERLLLYGGSGSATHAGTPSTHPYLHSFDHDTGGSNMSSRDSSSTAKIDLSSLVTCISKSKSMDERIAAVRTFTSGSKPILITTDQAIPGTLHMYCSTYAHTHLACETHSRDPMTWVNNRIDYWTCACRLDH